MQKPFGFLPQIAAVASIAACLAAAGDEVSYQTLSENGTMLTLNVPSGVVWTNTAAIPSTVTTIVKTGGGEACYFPLVNTTFTGDITISAGYLSGSYQSFGKPASITVEADALTGIGGAWLLLDEYPPCYTWSARTSIPFWNTKIKFCGKGPDGNGAFQRYHAHCDNLWDCLAASIELTGDTTFLGNTRWGVTCSVFNMNGHTLTIVVGSDRTHYGTARYTDGLNFFTLSRNASTTIKNPGPIVVERIGTYYKSEFFLEGSSAKLVNAADSEGTIAEDMPVTIRDGSRCNIFGGAASIHHDFPLFFEGKSDLRFNGSAYFDGPITMTGPSLSIYGYSKNGGNAYLYGGISAKTGTVIVAKEYKLNVNLLGGDEPRTNYLATLNHYGTGWNRGCGTVTVGDHEVYMMTNHWSIAGSGGVAAPAWLVMRDHAQLLDPVWKRSGQERLYVGSEGLAGVLCVEDDAVVSNRCYVADQGPGAVYQYGGSVYMLGEGDNTYIGNNGHLGYYMIAGGRLWADSWFNLGTGYARSHFIQYGGRVDIQGSSRPVRIGWNNAGYATWAQYGGTSVWKNYAVTGFASYTPSAVDIVSAITVSGGDTLMDLGSSYYGSYAAGGIIFCAATNSLKPTAATVNVNDGGTLRIGQIYCGQVSGTGTPAWSTISNLVAAATRSYVNGNGGVIKASRDGDFFRYSETDGRTREPSRFTVYEKGLTFDTDGHNVTVHKPVERPFGLGIASVSLPAELSAVTATNLLIGPTTPFIVDSTGRGADVIMAFDEKARRATNVTVNAHGFGFTSAPVVRFRKTKWDDGNFSDCAVTTVDFDDPSFVHGGFTKRGSGTLTLYATNTWGGATRLEGGTLAFAHSEGMPAGGTVEIAAAAAAALTASSAPLLTADTFRASGIVITEADTLDPDSTDWNRMKNVATFTNPLQAVPAITYRDTDGTASSAPKGWLAILRNGGRTLAYGYPRGTVLLLR